MVVFDLETQNLAAEVGGWGNKDLLRLAVGCTYDEDQEYQMYWEAQAADLLETLDRADFIVGYNVNDFDYSVLSFYGDTSGFSSKTFDLLDEIFQQTRRRLSLGHMALLNLGEAKGYASGADAIQLWRTGRIEELSFYCQRDVELTKDLFELWEAQGLLWTSDTAFVVWPGLSVGEEGEDE